MQDRHPVEHGITASRSDVMNVPASSPNFDPLVSQKPFEPFDLENENVVEINQHPFEKLWAKVGTRFYPSTALGVEVVSTYGMPMIEWNETLYLEEWYPKPYPNSIVLDANSTLLREMISAIDGLLTNEYDWDAIDYRKPTLEDINFAKDTLIKFVTVLGGCEGYLLTKPYISNSEDGGAKLEWHSGERSLYLRINRPEPVATTIVDNPDGTTTIDRKPFLQQSYLSLWKWLINE